MAAPKLKDRNFKLFYGTMFISAIVPSLNYILPFLPSVFLGFNWSGWAWLIMLLVTIYSFRINSKVFFPYVIWLPWIVYVLLYGLVVFSFAGFQLTLQYILPFLVGIQASIFKYDQRKLLWVFYWYLRMCFFYIFLFAIGYIFRGGLTPFSAAMPMLLSILASIVLGVFFKSKKARYLIFFLLILLIPVIDVTRMGLLVFMVSFIFHFGNSNYLSKIVFAFIGLAVSVFVFNSDSFQEKTFYSGKGDISDLSLDYYKNEELNDNGRTYILSILEKGIENKPLLGNGPRADLSALEFENIGIKEVHNDYISIEYNYGLIGLVFFLTGLFLSFFGIFFKVKRSNEISKVFAGNVILTLFLGFLLFMYSDNVLKYTVFYPNLLFAFIGIFYAESEEISYNSQKTK